MKPLYIWAGGKSKVLKHYKHIMPSKVNVYIEPFFGGGAMFIHVMNTYKPKQAHINDINPDIINIYHSIKNNYNEFLDTLNDLESKYIIKTKDCRKKYYYEIRDEHAWHYSNWSKPKEAAVLYFLMKTAFNGIYQVNKNTNGRYGTPSGLLNQTDKIYDRDTVSWWHNVLQNVNITSTDWYSCCENIGKGFYFMDPPYRDSFADYGNVFTEENLLNLIKFGNDNPDNDIMICNRDSDDNWFDINKGNLNIMKFPITYTAGRRKKTEAGFIAKPATEILLYNTKPKQNLLDIST